MYLSSDIFIEVRAIKLFVTFIAFLIVCAGLVLCFMLLLNVDLFSVLLVTLRLTPFFLFAAILLTGLIHTGHMYQEMRTATVVSITLLYLVCVFIFFGWSIFIYSYDDNSYQSFYYSNVDTARKNDFVLEYIFPYDRDIPVSRNGISSHYWELSWKDNNDAAQHINIAILDKKDVNDARYTDLLNRKKIHTTTVRHTKEALAPVSNMIFTALTVYDMTYSSLITSEYGLAMNVFSSDLFSGMKQGDRLGIHIIISLLFATFVLLIGMMPSKIMLFLMIYNMRFVYLYIIYWYVNNTVVLIACTVGLIVIMYAILIRMVRTRNTLRTTTDIKNHTGEYE